MSSSASDQPQNQPQNENQTSRQSRLRRVAVITGASGGLGAACAAQFVREGVAVAVVGRNRDRLRSLADQLFALSSTAEVVVLPVDLSTSENCWHVIDSTVAELGGVDVVVNSAGVYPRRPPLEIRREDWQHSFEVNVLATYSMMTEAIVHMKKHGGGRIVNITSIDGFKAHPANAHYAAMKAAVISLTRSLALEVAPLGILINSVAPGPMATDTAKATDWYQPMVDALPTRTPITPEEVSNVVSFLASANNVSITGENVVVSGGGLIV